MAFFGDVTDLLFRIPALLIAITFHEYAHARMAYAWGDSTARHEGRMTLNPISHLDPLGALMVMLVGFGWARPVPVNPYNFTDRRRGMLWVAVAGPGANLLLALAATIILVFSTGGLPFYRAAAPSIFEGTMIWIILINIYLAIFNFVPLPPLDGSKVLYSLLPSSYAYHLRSIEAYAPFILILLLITRILPRLLLPIASVIITVFHLVAIYLFTLF